VFQGLLTAKLEAIKQPDNFVKLWVHEAERIYGDRLVDAGNLATYKALSAELVSKSFSKFNLKKYFGANAEPLIFAQFVEVLMINSMINSKMVNSSLKGLPKPSENITTPTPSWTWCSSRMQ
jgi:hypothetical protein